MENKNHLSRYWNGQTVQSGQQLHQQSIRMAYSPGPTRIPLSNSLLWNYHNQGTNENYNFSGRYSAPIFQTSNPNYRNYYGLQSSCIHYPQSSNRPYSPSIAGRMLTPPLEPSQTRLYPSRSQSLPTNGGSYDRLDAFLKPRPPHSQDIIPKFYKSVIEDVIASVREIFLDDGIDEQVIQEMKQTWERKVSESRAVEHAVQQQQQALATTMTTTSSTNTTTTTTNSSSSKQSDKSSSKSSLSSTISQQGQTTSVITSNPNHVNKNGPSINNNKNNIRIKNEIDDSDSAQPVLQSQPVTLGHTNPTSNVMVTNQPTTTTITQSSLAPQHQQDQMFRASAIVSNNSIAGLAGASGTNAPTTVLQVPKRYHLQQTGKNQRYNINRNSPNSAAATTTATNNNSIKLGSVSSGSGSGSTFTNINSLATSSSNNGNSAKRLREQDNTINSNFNNQNHNGGSGDGRLKTANKIHHSKSNNKSIKSERGLHHHAHDNLNSLADAAVAISKQQQQQQQQPQIHIYGQSMPINLSISTHHPQQQLQQQFSQHNNQSEANLVDRMTNKSHYINSILNSNNNVGHIAAPTSQFYAAVSAASRFQMTTTGGPGHVINPSCSTSSSYSSSTSHTSTNQGGGSFGANHKEVKFQPGMIYSGPKLVLFGPNNMTHTGTTNPFVINSDLLNSLNIQPSIIAPGAQPVFSHPGIGAGTIQYATAIRSTAPQPGQPGSISTTMQQVRPVVTTLPTTQSSQVTGTRVAQLDGPHDQNDSSDDDDDDDEYRDNDDDMDDNDDEMNDEENEGGVEEEPLNSEDDVSDEDPVELFETDNVVVCQYDKITRSRNKWKFHFKDGIMNLQGKDFVFSRAVGDAEW